MSLRARLTAGLLAVATAGMVTVGAVIYAEQRSFLLDRVDDQVRAAFGPVTRELADQGVIDRPALRRDDGQRRPPPRGGPAGRGPAPVEALPPGTYGEQRDATGKVTGQPISLTYGEGERSPPDLPARIARDEIATVSSTDDSFEYRVQARDTPGGGVTIVAVPLDDVDETLDRLLLVEALVIGASLLVLALLTLAAVRFGLRPLDRFGTTADAIAGGDLSHRVSPATERTEVGRLGIALNRMLDRLQEAFAEREASEERLRRFLADASHELRTPLASIRGYSELFRLGAGADPEETAKSMRRIEEEAARMGLLVEELLMLARLDEQHPREHEPVAIAQVANDVVEDARATVPERSITLEADDEATVLGDALQLHQVLANLVRNAIVHTPDDAAIEVAARRSGDRVELEVRDHGPGLPPVDPAMLFERFWRSETGRVRGRAGAGLGLAIVAGIVAMHGGSVRAENAEGGGARFVVSLPAVRSGSAIGV